ncbi:MAG: glycogen debranching protein GlgX [Candidatus Nanopelagicales bacterium]|jgi:isoamylase
MEPTIDGPGAWDPLGLTLDATGASVALWAPGATAVDLCLFDDAGAEQRIRLPEQTFGVFHGHVAAVAPGARYGFRVDGPWDPAHGARWNPAKLLMDPYARALDGEFRLDPAVFAHEGSDDLTRNDADSAPFVPRSIAVATSFDWYDDRAPQTPWTDTVIYETHVRGISMQHPDVPEALRGTYAGLAHPAVVNHLLDLGITAVELLPIHHFVDETHLLELGLTNYWGYNTLGFFAPHGAYSASGSRGEQVREFKEMVRTLHSVGLEVILDVVYNHTAEGNELGPTLSFRGICNPGYYRLSDGRHYMDYTGCGNTLNVSNPHVLQMVMDSLRYWVTEMHVDGFRFDLASALARSFHDVDMLGTFMTTIQQDPILRRVKLIAEPWDVGPGGYQVGEFPTLWAEWNGRYRDNLRDFWRGASGVGELGWRLSGSADLYAGEGRRPYSSVNFVTAHDGFPMRDLTTYEHKHNEANLEDNRDGTDDNRSANYGVEGETDDTNINGIRHRQIRNMMATLVLSTGVPMILGGDEFGRTQGGNNNAYCQDNPISWYDWELQPWQSELLDFTKAVIALRREHRVFRQRYFFDGRPHHEGGAPDLGWVGPDGQPFTNDEWNTPWTKTLGMYLSGELHQVPGEPLPPTDDSFLFIVHASDDELDFTLPGEPFGASYDVAFDTGSLRPPGPIPAGTALRLTPRSSVLLRVAS